MKIARNTKIQDVRKIQSFRTPAAFQLRYSTHEIKKHENVVRRGQYSDSLTAWADQRSKPSAGTGSPHLHTHANRNYPPVQCVPARPSLCPSTISLAPRLGRNVTDLPPPSHLCLHDVLCETNFGRSEFISSNYFYWSHRMLELELIHLLVTQQNVFELKTCIITLFDVLTTYFADRITFWILGQCSIALLFRRFRRTVVSVKVPGSGSDVC